MQKKLFTRISNCLNTYIHTERRDFKTLSIKNYTIGWSSCYLLNFEHGTDEHNIDSAYGVCMHQAQVNFTADKFDSLFLCIIMMFFFNCLLGEKFVTQPLWFKPEYCEAMKQRNSFKRVGYCENSLEKGQCHSHKKNKSFLITFHWQVLSQRHISSILFIQIPIAHYTHTSSRTPLQLRIKELSFFIT